MSMPEDSDGPGVSGGPRNLLAQPAVSELGGHRIYLHQCPVCQHKAPALLGIISINWQHLMLVLALHKAARFQVTPYQVEPCQPIQTVVVGEVHDSSNRMCHHVGGACKGANALTAQCCAPSRRRARG